MLKYIFATLLSNIDLNYRRSSFVAINDLFDLGLTPGPNFLFFSFKLAACRPMEVIFQFLLNADQKIWAILENIFFQISSSKWKIFPCEIQGKETLPVD